MSAFSDMLAADVLSTFLNVDEFAEQLTYWSVDAPGVAVSVAGVVHRHNRKEEAQQYHRTEGEMLDVSVSALTITSPKTGDLIRLADDAADVRHTFIEQTHRDAQMRVLRFKRIRITKSGEKPNPL
jgi:hypothetical protein